MSETRTEYKTGKSKKGDSTKMALTSVSIKREMLNEAKAKAAEDERSFAWVVRKLVKGWLDGKIDISKL